MSEQHFEFDVFLSHASADKLVVRELAERLRKDGLRVWLDEWVIKPGDSISLAIEQGLERSRMLILFMSKAAFDSEWVALERHTSLFRDPTNQERRFIPLRLDDCTITDVLKQFAYVDWREKNQDQYNRLLDSCRSGNDSLSQLFSIPWSKNKCFTGRENTIVEIHKRLSMDSKGGSVVALSGLGGMGKTQVAIEFCYRNREEYRALFWISATSRQAFQRGLIQIAQRLGLGIGHSYDENKLALAAKKWLYKQTDYLLILDSLDDPSIVSEFLKDEPRGHIIITTRRHLLDSMGINDTIAITGWSKKDSFTFLESRTDSKITKSSESKAVSLLFQELEGFPLAFEQVGAFVYSTDVTFSWYLEHYQERKLELLERGIPTQGSYNASVATTWIINFSQVKEESISSFKLLELSAYFCSHKIPIFLISNGIRAFQKKEYSKYYSELIATIPSEDRIAVFDVLQPLQKYSLITIQGQYESYSIHRLVQEVMRDITRESASFLGKCAMSLVSEALSPEKDESDRLSLDERGHILPHAEYIIDSQDTTDIELSLYVKYLLATAETSADFGRTEYVIELLKNAFEICSRSDYEPLVWWDQRTEIAQFFHAIGQESDAEHVLFSIIKDFNARYGKNSDASALARLQLAWFYLETGHLSEALIICEYATTDLVNKPKIDEPFDFVIERAACIAMRIFMHYGLSDVALELVDKIKCRGPIFSALLKRKLEEEFPNV
ncbi:tetratricopeptide repeat protein [Gimesia fumaroli]|uniref:NB-ARC domain protein n=1 Tax=Gimesia fumaroli TaxID=2527976 RepID=A0A518I8Y9_9PLAN|nr:toll/interleukin-1 receptor domain-containing protein [Gimesia fumaroli]QDV49575.1 NB-ARC domain protein [Gimesia fumaroli]